MSDAPRVVSVEILGQQYPIRSPLDASYVADLAAYVDEQIRSTADIGDVVFTLVELELLMSQPTDSRDEFLEVFAFDQAFEREYPWGSALAV